MLMTPRYLISSSYGNDSVALIQWARELMLQDVAVIYADTQWASDAWKERVTKCEAWVARCGFTPLRAESEGFKSLVRRKKSFPRQGMQFCTQTLKIEAISKLAASLDPLGLATVLIGVRREESARRAAAPLFEISNIPNDGRRVIRPLALHTAAERDLLLHRAGFSPLPHRSDECYPCINANRADLRRLASDEDRVQEIAAFENDMGVSSNGAPRTMFRPYRYMGATGIRDIIRWAQSERGDFSLDDGAGKPCEEEACGL